LTVVLPVIIRARVVDGFGVADPLGVSTYTNGASLAGGAPLVFELRISTQEDANPAHLVLEQSNRQMKFCRCA
jgi:hypothetical protein